MKDVALLDDSGETRRSRSYASSVVSVGIVLFCACGLVALSLSTPSRGDATIFADDNPANSKASMSKQETPQKEPPLSPEVQAKLRLPARILGEIGGLLLVLPTLSRGVTEGNAGFKRIFEKVGLCAPGVLGWIAFAVTIVGSICVLVGPVLGDELADKKVGKPHEMFGRHDDHYTVGGIVTMVGAYSLMLFICATTYTQHFKPMQAAPDGDNSRIKHQLAIVKALGVFGGLFVAASSGAVMGKLPFRQDICGRILCCAPCLMAVVGMGFRGFINIATEKGMPLPPVAGVLAVVFSGGGSILVVIARFLPGYKLVARGAEYSLWATIIGGSMVSIFLAIATVSGHLRPMLQYKREGNEDEAQHHYRDVLQNLSLIGGQLVIISCGLINP